MDTRQQETIERTFTHHLPTGTQVERYAAIRAKAKEFAVFIAENTTPSKEQSVALTKLDEVVMWTNAGIARNENKQTEEKAA